MKIIHIISSLAAGGAEKLVIELANEQSKNNITKIVSFRNVIEDMILKPLINKNVQLIELGKSKGFKPKIYWKLYTIIKSIEPDIVHFHLDSTIKYVVPLAYIFNKVKYVYTIHSKLNNLNINNFRILNNYFNFKKNIKYVCISSTIKREFTKKFKKLDFYCITNGVNKIQGTDLQESVKHEVKSYKKNEQTKLAIAVGRVDKVKNHILLVKAFAKLQQQNISVIILGKTFNEESEIMQEIKKNNSGNVHFLGLKRNVGDYLNVADAFIITSLFEGIPISVLEALSVGLPIISTPAGGMVDIVEDGINGFVSNDFTVDNFVRQISLFLKLDTKELQEMKIRNIKKHRDMYSMELCSMNYLELYLK